MALALLMPGTSQDAVRPRKFNVTVGAGGFTHAAALLVDGMWNKEGNTGEPRMDLPQAAIREFKVYVSQAPAEYGWTAGGVVTLRDEKRDQPVERRSLRVLPRQAPQHDEPVRAGTARHAWHPEAGLPPEPVRCGARWPDRAGSRSLLRNSGTDQDQPLRHGEYGATRVLLCAGGHLPDPGIQQHGLHAGRCADQSTTDGVRAVCLAGLRLYLRGLWGQARDLLRERHPAETILAGWGAIPGSCRPGS